MARGLRESAPCAVSISPFIRASCSARALVHDPQLVVCDEPTSNLDHRTGHQVLSLLRGLAQRANRSLIVVTHDTRILEFADRVARIDDGRIVDVRDAGRGEDTR